MWTAVGMLFSRSGATIEKVWRGNPAFKWTVLVLVGLFALDLAARETFSFWRETIAVRKDAETVQSTIQRTNDENNTAAATARQTGPHDAEQIKKSREILKQYGVTEGVISDPKVDTSPKAQQKYLLSPDFR